MTDETPTIRVSTGSYVWNKPNEEQTMVKVELPKYDFNYEFTYRKNQLGKWLESEPWHRAIDEITVVDPKYIGDQDPYDELKEILDEHHDELEERWEEHRKEEIDDEIESLKEEKQSL